MAKANAKPLSKDHVATQNSNTDMVSGRNEEYVKRVINNCPLGRLKETRDVALVVGFLATDASKWINGQVVRVSGGYI
nr:short-chain type dehydrogenase/reductase [Quercus suber]